MSKSTYKCTESWVLVAISALGALMSTGIVAEGSMASQIVGGILAVAGALGYGKARVDLKTAQIEYETFKQESANEAPVTDVKEEKEEKNEDE